MRCKMQTLATAVAMATATMASADTLDFGVNWGPAGSSDPLVGLAVKVESGSASMGSITGGSTYGLGSGWYQTTLADSFLAGTNPTTSSSQYGFVRGGGGDTAATANSVTGAIGFSASLVLVPGYSAADGDQVNAIFAFFKADGNLSVQGLVNWSYTTANGWDRTVYFNNAVGYWPWSQADSGTFAELSAGVVPGPMGVAAIAGLGLAGRRRRR
jgi:hypothetical protein